MELKEFAGFGANWNMRQYHFGMTVSVYMILPLQ